VTLPTTLGGRPLGWRAPQSVGRLHVGIPPVGIGFDGLPLDVILGGLPPMYDQGQVGSCHDDHTEVLTEDGFKLFSHLTGTERLATVDPNTSELTFELPTRLVRFPYEGELYCGSSELSLDFRVTPDHQMLVRKWNERDRTLNSHYELVQAKGLGWYFGLMNRVTWKGETQPSSYTLPGVDHKRKVYRVSRDVPMASWLRFLGVYLAEGTLLKRGHARGRISYKIQIAASKDREKEFVRAVLSEIGVHALELKDRFTFSDKQVYDALSSLDLEGVKAGDKFVPPFVFRLSGALIREFLAGHFAGDGCEQDGRRCHYTGSHRLATDLQTLVFLSGDESRISIRAPRTATMLDGRVVRGVLPEHRVSVCNRKGLSVDRAEKMSVQKYQGEVFCAEVPTHHTLVTRRNGKILISGNCTAHALAGAVEILHTHQSLPSLRPDRMALYWYERAMEGNIMEDAGALIADGVTALRRGYAAETRYIGSWGQEWVTRPTNLDPDAPRLVNSDPLTIDPGQVMYALASGFPVVIGVRIPLSWETLTGDTIPLPGAPSIGGHAVTLVGYRRTADGVQFRLRNSWGESWGDGGYAWMPSEYLTLGICGEAYALRAVRNLQA
jgi:hypothetical protein